MILRATQENHNTPTNYTIAALLCKAFDTVWCNKLVRKLNLLYLVELYHGFPEQKEIQSELTFQEFSGRITIAGIEEEVSRGCEIGIFADDIMIWRSDRYRIDRK